MKKRIMKFLSVLFISVMTLGTLSSCETTYAATVTDDMYYPYDPEYATVNMILEYGVPYYLNGVLQYYIYRDLYYYPFYYNDIMYFRTFYRPLPPNHHYNFGRPHRGDVGFGHHRPHKPHNGVRPHNDNHRPNGNHQGNRPGGSNRPQHQPGGHQPSHQPGHTNTTRPGTNFGNSRPSQQRPNTNQRVTTRPSSTRVAPPAESRVFSNPPSTSGGSHSNGSHSFGGSSGGSRGGFGGSGSGGGSRGSSGGGSRGGFGGRR